MNGDLGHAVLAGRAALAKQPRFSAALRYLTASYGLQDRTEDARATYVRLLKEDPDAADPGVMKQRFRLLHKETEQHVFKGLTNSGI